VYRKLQQALLARIQTVVQEKYGDSPVRELKVEQPPKIELGELALPVAFELAKRLKKAPRAIAQELQGELAGLEGVAAVEIAGAGYLNIKLDRATFAKRLAAGESAAFSPMGFTLVEHTSINPNKAAHVGHLRNAILGDTFVRLLRARGVEVGVQNYVDNTGVQVADIVIGMTQLEKMTPADVQAWIGRMRATDKRIDFYCWDLYALVSQWYEAEPEQAAARKKIRLDTLHALEQGGNSTAAIAEMISTGVLHCHLVTMQRLGIEYDFLPRESEILHLHFWEAAFALMKERGVLYLETEGKNKGCWVMKRAGNATASANAGSSASSAEQTAVGMTEDVGPDEDAKIIVRSNGTVTYVGKDIAYHLWKFGLLPGKDFGYRKFHEYATHTCWVSTVNGETPHPHFGKAEAIYNVIDSRQNDPQNNVIAALRGMGYNDAADHYTHFSYEMVALTPRCAEELGYTLSAEDRGRSYIEVSGRKGFGVKADDLLDRLVAAAKAEADTRHPELSEEERAETARKIAVGALRYFMLKFTRNTVIAFDFREALSFEGETGPYVQYAVVRAGNIFRKAGVSEQAALENFSAGEIPEIPDDIWEVWLLASRLTVVLEQSIQSTEPAHLAKYAFQLAQQFNIFYHRHHILTEQDAQRKKLLLATAAVAKREMVRALGWLGIEAPEVM
jgi:arginyl-tRNA synthetase